MREEIIKMAKAAGMEQDGDNFFSPSHEEIDVHITDLERFFHMAQAAMVEQGWRKCAEGQRTTQFCGMTEKAVQEEREEFAKHAVDIARRAIAEEREACAKVCEEYANGLERNYSEIIAAAIRARGQA